MQSYSMELNLGRIHVEEAGTGPVLLCIHGLGGGAWFFTSLAERLHDRFRILSLDLPCTGSSLPQKAALPGPSLGFKDFSIARCVDAIVEILAAHPSGTVSLVGHSMGTMIALEVNARCPGKLRSLIFVGGLPKITEGIRQKLTSRTREVQQDGMVGMGHKIVSGVFSRGFRSQNPKVIDLFSQKMEALPAEGYLKGMQELLTADMTEAVAKITIPSLTLIGSEDQYAPPHSAKPFFQTIPGNATYREIPGCGHLPFLEAPEAFAREVAEYLDSVAVTPAIK